MLAMPPTLGVDGQLETQVEVPGPTGTVRFALDLSPGCFRAHASDERMLTKQEILESGWRHNGDTGENHFLRQLANFAPRLVDHRNRATLERVMTWMLQAMHNARGDLVGREHIVNLALCRQLVDAGLTPRAEGEDVPTIARGLFFYSLSLVLKNVVDAQGSLDDAEIAEARAQFRKGYAALGQHPPAVSAALLNGDREVYVGATNMVLEGTFRDGVMTDGEIYFQWSTGGGIRYNALVKDGTFLPPRDREPSWGKRLGPQVFPAEFAARPRNEKDVESIVGPERREAYGYFRAFPGEKRAFEPTEWEWCRTFGNCPEITVATVRRLRSLRTLYRHTRQRDFLAFRLAFPFALVVTSRPARHLVKPGRVADPPWRGPLAGPTKTLHRSVRSSGLRQGVASGAASV